MNANTLKKVHRFSKVGKIILTVLLVLNILATVAAGVTSAVMAALPRDTVSVSVTSQAVYQSSGKFAEDLWQVLMGGLMGGRQFETVAATNGYVSADMHMEGEQMVIETTSVPMTYTCGDVVRILLFTALASAATAVMLWLLRKLFKVIEGCGSVFCEELVKKMKALGWSLLPVAVLASVAETVTRRFMATGVTGIYIQWGLLIAFAVTMCLTVVFHYGVQLQRESDETL